MNKRIFTIMAIGAAVFLAGLRCTAFDPRSALEGLVNAVTSTDKFEVASLEGTWKYVSPAISFKSDNALNKAGGAAASAAIESKLAPYYTKLGLSKVQIVFDAEGNFTISINKIKLTGTVTKDDDQGNLTFNFKANSSINLGKVSAAASKSATGQLTLTFDASRVISIVDKVASLSGNSTLSTLSSLLNSYDGVYAGAKFKKQ